jgi:hypothetical protein
MQSMSLRSISGAYTLHTGDRDRSSQQARTLHPDTDHAEANPIAGRNGLKESAQRLRFKQYGLGEQEASGGCGRSSLQECTARKIPFLHANAS